MGTEHTLRLPPRDDDAMSDEIQWEMAAHNIAAGAVVGIYTPTPEDDAKLREYMGERFSFLPWASARDPEDGCTYVFIDRSLPTLKKHCARRFHLVHDGEEGSVPREDAHGDTA